MALEEHAEFELLAPANATLRAFKPVHTVVEHKWCWICFFGGFRWPIYMDRGSAWGCIVRYSKQSDAGIYGLGRSIHVSP